MLLCSLLKCVYGYVMVCAEDGAVAEYNQRISAFLSTPPRYNPRLLSEEEVSGFKMTFPTSSYSDPSKTLSFACAFS